MDLVLLFNQTFSFCSWNWFIQIAKYLSGVKEEEEMASYFVAQSDWAAFLGVPCHCLANYIYHLLIGCFL
jgi:hypothetical protein